MDNPQDPSDFIRNPPSVIVKVQNSTQDSANCKFGVAVYYSLDRGRYVVQMIESQQSLSFKPENLVRASAMERAWAGYQRCWNDQRLRQKYYRLASKAIPAGIKPEIAAVILGFFLLISMFLWGWKRVLWSLFPVILVTFIVYPDIAAQDDLPGWYPVMAHFPVRCRQRIEQFIPMTRGHVSDEVAEIVVVVFLAFNVYTIFMSILPNDKDCLHYLFPEQNNNAFSYNNHHYFPMLGYGGMDFGMNPLPLIQY